MVYPVSVPLLYVERVGQITCLFSWQVFRLTGSVQYLYSSNHTYTYTNLDGKVPDFQ